MSKAMSASAKLAKGATKVEEKEDVIVGVAEEVENLSQPKVFSLIPDVSDAAGRSEFRLGGLLARILDESTKEGGEAWLNGHSDFKTLVDKEFSIHPHKAVYLVKFYKKMAEEQIPWEEVKGLGWTKLKELTPVITNKNVGKWVKMASKLTVVELMAHIRQLKKEGKKDADEADAQEISTMTFKLHPDQKESVRSALDKVKGEADTKFDSQALHLMALAVLNEATTQKESKVEKPEKAKSDPKEELKALMVKVGWEETITIFGDLFPDVSVQVEA